MLVCYTRTETATGEASRCCRFAPFHAGMPRRQPRYPTDTTDGQWAVIDPLPPGHCRCDLLRGR